MRTVYLGTSEFAADVLGRLHDSPHRPALVVSRPDRPQGRGRRLTSPPVVTLARELGIDTDQPDSVNGDDARTRIASVRPECLIVCAFGALIKEPLLSEHGPILNVHPSLLPRWRGAAPIERAILAGDETTGVSIMELTAGLDSGPIRLQQPEPILPSDDYGTLAARLAQLGGDLLLRALDEAAAAGPGAARDAASAAGGPGDAHPQDDALATYAGKLTPEDRRLDPTRPAAELARRVRALSPHVGAYLKLEDGSRLGVWQAATVVSDPARAPGQPLQSDCSELAADDRKLGKLALKGSTPLLACGDGWLELVTVQPPGRKRMSGADYARGLRR